MTSVSAEISSLERRQSLCHITVPERQCVKLLLLCIRLVWLVLAQVSHGRQGLSNSPVSQFKLIKLFGLLSGRFIAAKVFFLAESFRDISVPEREGVVVISHGGEKGWDARQERQGHTVPADPQWP